MIELSDELKVELIARAVAHAPHETCGMVASGEHGLVLFGAENAAQRPTDSFLISPKDQIEILAEIFRRGERLAAIYHSHPQGLAAPSPRDRVMAEGWPGVAWVIVALGGPQPAIWVGYP